MSNSKDEVNISKLYGEDCLLSKDEFIKKHNLNVNGLSSSEALENNRKYGLNEIKQSKSKKWYNYFFDSLFSPFNIILLGIVLLLCYTDIYLPETPSYSNIIVILILITASTFLDFFEEYRSNKAAENLKELVATTCTVIRDGKEISIPMKNVTLNDIVFFLLVA